jgi:hypothetical protein
MYMYQAAIPEELSFAKGDILAVLRLQDDGWWEAEVAGKNGRPGLVPSNYLQNWKHVSEGTKYGGAVYKFVRKRECVGWIYAKLFM